MGTFSMIKIDIIRNSSYSYFFFRSFIAAFMFIINLMFDIIISLHPAVLVPSIRNSFIMLINILYNFSIILTKFVTYYGLYSQNYAGIIGSGLIIAMF